MGPTWALQGPYRGPTGSTGPFGLFRPLLALWPSMASMALGPGVLVYWALWPGVLVYWALCTGLLGQYWPYVLVYWASTGPKVRYRTYQSLGPKVRYRTYQSLGLQALPYRPDQALPGPTQPGRLRILIYRLCRPRPRPGRHNSVNNTLGLQALPGPSRGR